MPTFSADRVCPPTPGGAAGQRGRTLAVGLVLMGLVAAATAILFQRQQTRRCLEFYGADHARRIAAAPAVELLFLEPGATPASVAVRIRRDVSHAAGLVHLRRGLVEDANFSWDAGPEASADGTGAPAVTDRLPLDAWDIALEFSEPLPGGREPQAAVRRTQLIFDLGPGGGAVSVVGKPGRIGLGRIGPGIEKWVRGLDRDADAPAGR
jgi:hypothetical protein